MKICQKHSRRADTRTVVVLNEARRGTSRTRASSPNPLTASGWVCHVATRGGGEEREKIKTRWKEEKKRQKEKERGK